METPSALKKDSIRIKAFPKLSFQISIKGECEMIYRIVEKDKFKVLGIDFFTTIVDNACYKEIPEFCDRIFKDGTHSKINEILRYHKMNLLDGIYYDFKEDGSRRYMMGGEFTEKNITQGFKVLDIPANTWAVFEGKGGQEQKLLIQDIWKRIYSEWFPSLGFEQIEGPCIEKYFWDDDQYDNYTCEVWIPVKRK
ncbi:Predicted transcriptional regulator YdeE, contains AraC-type DNA-binding domain [Clostridium frigidicarnis]|uniref:Predicted transcriptional regulator YdeE, contains AraC-type DNA-binding domain n=2 Tax=Clostridium frigidicarnis TaxID=84698 RepID=A0A1I1AYL7_9CLOT|nr:Predicted transcriptional regulator YdeE, contains AraC-type DNA-binding domain [Clostridium frigidicarnis]